MFIMLYSFISVFFFLFQQEWQFFHSVTFLVTVKNERIRKVLFVDKDRQARKLTCLLGLKSANVKVLTKISRSFHVHTVRGTTPVQHILLQMSFVEN